MGVRRATGAEGDDILRQDARVRYRDGVSVMDRAQAADGMRAPRASAVDGDDLSAVVTGYGDDRTGARRPVRRAPAVPDKGASSR